MRRSRAATVDGLATKAAMAFGLPAVLVVAPTITLIQVDPSNRCVAFCVWTTFVAIAVWLRVRLVRAVRRGAIDLRRQWSQSPH